MSDVPFENQMYYRKLQERQKQYSELSEVENNGCLGVEDRYEEEKLLLLPEEVICLTFGVGCLSLHTRSSENLSFDMVWKKLVKRNPDFPFVYAVYHYFRSKNWVPKSGLQYGGDYGKAFEKAGFVV